MRRTILEWYNLVDLDDLRGLLLMNLNPNNAQNVARNISEAISVGFIWAETPEGNAFWNSIFMDANGIPLRIQENIEQNVHPF